jgi:hypothetical protein
MSSSPRVRRPSAPLVLALAALFVALGGPAQAARLIDGDDIRRGTVGSKQVKDRSLKARDLSKRAVRSLTATADRSITAAKLAPGAVTTPALAPGSVMTGSVADNSLTAADLAASSVGVDEVADNAVGQAEIRNNGVGASEIADNTIDGGEIIDGGLSIRDLAAGVGTFEWPVGSLAAGGCEIRWVQLDGSRIAGDFVLVSPVSAWPAGLVYTANGTSSETEFKVQVCNRGAQAVTGASYLFNYAILGS